MTAARGVDRLGRLAGREIPDVVFLVDVDDTLIDNDRFELDLQEHLEHEYGPAARDR